MLEREALKQSHVSYVKVISLLQLCINLLVMFSLPLRKQRVIFMQCLVFILINYMILMFMPSCTRNPHNWVLPCYYVQFCYVKWWTGYQTHRICLLHYATHYFCPSNINSCRDKVTKTMFQLLCICNFQCNCPCWNCGTVALMNFQTFTINNGVNKCGCSCMYFCVT